MFKKHNSFLYTYAAGAQSSIGVCNGMGGDDLPSPQDVVQLYKSLGITKMRIYAPNNNVMEALRGSGIGLVLGVENGDIPGLATTQANAASWVQTNIQPYHPDVNVMYVAVGNEVPDGVAESIVPAMHNIETALAAAGLADGIKVSTCIRLDMITNTFPPSMGTFAKPYMGDVAQFLAATGAPLLANVYPYFGYRYRAHPDDISVGYATFQPGTTTRDTGNGLTYTNLFDAMVDSVYAALEKVGAPNVSVVVSESGWPSAGGPEASTENAQNYNQGLIDHVGQGTPKRPGPLETYVFAMFNENQKPGEPTERNFGLFYPNKSPVYPITFR
jgi:exo-beta-1,3-glucanase (GH17 family)